MIRIICPHCGNKVPASKLGYRVVCNACGKVLLFGSGIKGEDRRATVGGYNVKVGNRG